MNNQTSAIFGTAKFGLTIFSQILSQAGGMPRQIEGGIAIPNPFTRRAATTTTWTRKV